MERTSTEGVLLRLLGPTDSLAELTLLLHRAYARLGAMGLNYTAVDQTPEVTRERTEGRECYVAESGGRIVGTVAFHLDQRDRPPCARREDLAYLSQFGVEPELQGSGIGGLLLDRVEERAVALGFPAIALDTAIPATHLVRFYEKRGYRPIGEDQFAGKTYRSVVLAKALAGRSPSEG
jgi:GNAT superfamily N-acetyltransferase